MARLLFKHKQGGWPGDALSLSVTPKDSSVAALATLQFTATLIARDGSTTDVTALATWGSSDVAAATVDSSGLATGVAAGETVIAAGYGDTGGSTKLTVT